MRILFGLFSWTILPALLVFSGQIHAQEASTSSNWKKLYETHQYAAALESLQSLKSASDQSRQVDPYYYFNLGTVYYRLGRLGPALGYLERAHRLVPNDPDIQLNLSLARASWKKKTDKDDLDPTSTWLEDWVDHVPLDPFRTVLGLLAMVVLFLWIRSYWKTHNLRKSLSSPVALIGVLGLSIGGAFYGLKGWIASSPPAVCLTPIAVRSGPGNDYLQLAQLTEGTQVRILKLTSSNPSEDASSPETWQQIRYSSNDIGWVPLASLLTLEE